VREPRTSERFASLDRGPCPPRVSGTRICPPKTLAAASRGSGRFRLLGEFRFDPQTRESPRLNRTRNHSRRGNPRGFIRRGIGPKRQRGAGNGGRRRRLRGGFGAVHDWIREGVYATFERATAFNSSWFIRRRRTTDPFPSLYRNKNHGFYLGSHRHRGTKAALDAPQVLASEAN